MQSLAIKDYSIQEYEQFMAIKKLPMHHVDGNVVHYNDFKSLTKDHETAIASHLWDYQQFIVRLCLAKKKFAIFADVGLGKTAIFLEWINHVSASVNPKKTLIITQLHLIRQTIEEQMKFYGQSTLTDINRVYGGNIESFLNGKELIGIVNIDKFNNRFALRDRVGAIVLDESSCLKSETSVRRTSLIDSCKGIPCKLCCTATPAPNDRQEYANHALFLGYIDNYKQFFTRYFYNTGNGNEFVLKPHAKTAFYSFLATWSIFVKHPGNYGFADNLKDLKPAEVIWDRIQLTEQQRKAVCQYASNGQLNLFGVNVGGITNRSKISQISKGFVYQSGEESHA